MLPVNFAIFQDALVFRSMPGTKLSHALRGAIVAFEVDDYDLNGDIGWSVLIQGQASEITDAEQVDEVRDLPLRHLSPRGADDYFVRVAMTTVTGRRIRPHYGDRSPAR